MRVLVTGVSGFSGQMIASRLGQLGHDVFALIRLGCQLPPMLTGRMNIFPVFGELESFDFYPKSIDAVIHAAARSSAPGCELSEMLNSNIMGTQHIADYAKNSGAHTFVYLSSLSIYGLIHEEVVDPDTPSINPDPYGLSKLLGEHIVNEYVPSYRALSIRLPGVVGPHSVRNWLTLCRERARRDEPISIFNPQSLFNNAIHVEDLANFVEAVLTHPWAGIKAVTVGASDAIPLLQVVEELIVGTKSKSKIEIHSARKSSFLISNTQSIALGYVPMTMRTMINRFAREA